MSYKASDGKNRNNIAPEDAEKAIEDGLAQSEVCKVDEMSGQ